MATLPNLGLNGDIANRSAWGDEYRANDRRVDALVMATVKDRLATPPALGSRVDGDRYLIIATATSDWAGHENQITQWHAPSATWYFYAPKLGWEVYIEDEGGRMRFENGVWFFLDSVVNVRDFGVLGNGTTDDEPALNLLFNYVGALTSGPTTVYFPKGTYLIKDSLIVDGESLVSPVV